MYIEPLRNIGHCSLVSCLIFSSHAPVCLPPSHVTFTTGNVCVYVRISYTTAKFVLPWPISSYLPSWWSYLIGSRSQNVCRTAAPTHVICLPYKVQERHFLGAGAWWKAFCRLLLFHETQARISVYCNVASAEWLHPAVPCKVLGTFHAPGIRLWFEGAWTKVEKSWATFWITSGKSHPSGCRSTSLLVAWRKCFVLVSVLRKSKREPANAAILCALVVNPIGHSGLVWVNLARLHCTTRWLFKWLSH